MSNRNRTAAIKAMNKTVLRLQRDLGVKANVDIMQAMALTLASIASKQGQQSVECPIEKIKEEAEAVLGLLSEAFR